MAPETGLAFDAVPEIYDRIRPTYPKQLFRELFSRIKVAPRILEIGPGTGQATASLLARGAHVIAVEPGPRMADFLHKKFGSDSGLTVINEKFEDMNGGAAFDAVFAATSFHWVDAKIRLRKAHSMLRPSGSIAIVSTNQVKSDADGGYFDACQPIYRKYFPDEGPPPLQAADEVTPAEFEEIDTSDLFSEPMLFRYPWDQTYTSEDYGLLVRSYSGTNMMALDARESLVSDLCALADAEFAGTVTRPLVITLAIAQRS